MKGSIANGEKEARKRGATARTGTWHIYPSTPQSFNSPHHSTGVITYPPSQMTSPISNGIHSARVITR